MNRYTSGKHRKKTNVKKTSRILNSYVMKPHAKMNTTRNIPKRRAKHSSNRRMKLSLKNFKLVYVLILFAIILAIANKKEISAYFTDIKSATNIFSINAEYTITFDSNTGIGTMDSQNISYNIGTMLSSNEYTREGYAFDKWNTKADGTGTSYNNNEQVINIGDLTLYAQWKKLNVKYAVQIYGINQDEDQDGNILGLTFGPATGSDYNNSYSTHSYESNGDGTYKVVIIKHNIAANGTETTNSDYLKNSEGNYVIRTEEEKNKYDINIHELSWQEISNIVDKTRFMDCMLCGDTKSIEFDLNNSLASDALSNSYGDGPGMLRNSIKSYYRMWNPSKDYNAVAINGGEYGSNAKEAGGYAASHVRATLIGNNSKTDVTYAGNVNLDVFNSLYSTIKGDLKDLIVPKRVNYVTGIDETEYTRNIIYDKIWLFSDREISGTGEFAGNGLEGIGNNGVRYDKFANTESRYYLSSYVSGTSPASRKSYSEDGTTTYWWLRSPYLVGTGTLGSNMNGNVYSYYSRATNGIAFGFCINGDYEVKYDANGGNGTMSNQKIIDNVATHLTSNSFTREGYNFVGWNTNADGSGTSYIDGEEVTNIGSVTLYAQWKEIVSVKYAVQIYGINQDEDTAGNKLGLTFGPATGANYNNAYVTHEYEETSSGSGVYYVKIVTHTVAANGTETITSEYLKNSSGTNVTRTEVEKNKYNKNLHAMTWQEIENIVDKTEFIDCMLCGDTKSVTITLNSTIAKGEKCEQYGDGAGTLNDVINPYYLKWNPRQSENSAVGTGVSSSTDELTYGSNASYAGGYSVSHIRASLIGENNKTNIGYAGDVNLNENNCLYSCIESDLKEIIAAKKIKYVTGTSTSSYSLNEDIADKIWLFSSREMYGTESYNGIIEEGIGNEGHGYDKFGNTDSKYHMPVYEEYDSDARALYSSNGTEDYCWMRTVIPGVNISCIGLNYEGFWSFSVWANLGGSFGFCINGDYEVSYDANSGNGTMPIQTITDNVAIHLTSNSFTRDGYKFVGWNTKADGSGTSYTDGEEVTNLGNVTLYAQWEQILSVKYAVQIYGINEDVDEYNNPLGLTFGPATGENYNDKYVTHEYEETSSGSGVYNVKIVTHTVAASSTETTTWEYLKNSEGTNVTRTEMEKNKYNINMHNMTWEQIANETDKTRFLDCMLCGDTKSVTLTLNNTIANGTTYYQFGDGAGILYKTLDSKYVSWNPSPAQNARNAGGYSSSHIRATLIGKNSKTKEEYAGNVNLSTSNSLYSCIESDLRNVITAKKIRYVTGTSKNSYELNDDIADKIWLFSEREIYGNGYDSGNTTEGLGLDGHGYDKFGNINSRYYLSTYTTSHSISRETWLEESSVYNMDKCWWTRSPNLINTTVVKRVDYDGSLNNEYAYGSGNDCTGISFGFCIN